MIQGVQQTKYAVESKKYAAARTSGRGLSFNGITILG